MASQSQSPKEITIPLCGHSKVNPKEYQPAVGGHRTGEGDRMVLGICPSRYKCCYNGLEAHFSWRTLHNGSQHMAATANWLAGLQADRHLHTLRVTHKDSPPPPLPSDRLRRGIGQFFGGTHLGNGSAQDVEFGKGRTQTIRIDTNYRAGTGCWMPLYMPVIKLLMAGFQREGRECPKGHPKHLGQQLFTNQYESIPVS